MPYVVKDKIKFLAEASKILTSTLDYNVTLAIVAKLVTNNVADFCIVDVFEGRKLNRLAVNVSDPKKQELALKMFDFVPNPKNKDAIYDTAKQGTPVIIEKATKEWLKTVSQIPEERQTIKALGLNSHVFAPLRSRGEVIGVLTIASTDKFFSYSQEDAIFIEELADRAGTAVDKARLYKEAQDAVRSRDEFLSIASHELKTPLTTILLNIQGILKKLTSTPKEELELENIVKMLEVSKAQSQRMSRMINDLLNVSVASTGRLGVEKEDIELSSLVHDSILSFKERLASKKVPVYFKPADETWGRWDKIRLQQVVENLISNAIKYGGGKPIRLSLLKNDGFAVLKVKDSGIGIEKNESEVIFDKFKRAVPAKEISGLGVGLYISKQIIEAHSGEITVESSKGKGTTFTVKLPL